MEEIIRLHTCNIFEFNKLKKYYKINFKYLYKNKMKQMELRKFITTTIREYLNENVNQKEIVAYHGGDKLDDFDYNEIGTAKHGNIFGNGFYFTTEYYMALDFAFKTGKDYGFIYKCSIKPKIPFITTEREIMKLQFDYLNDNEDIDLFWDDLKNKYDCLIVNNRKFGGNMKFPNKYENFTEIVVYDKSIITILDKERV